MYIKVGCKGVFITRTRFRGVSAWFGTRKPGLRMSAGNNSDFSTSCFYPVE